MSTFICLSFTFAGYATWKLSLLAGAVSHTPNLYGSGHISTARIELATLTPYNLFVFAISPGKLYLILMVQMSRFERTRFCINVTSFDGVLSNFPRGYQIALFAAPTGKIFDN